MRKIKLSLAVVFIFLFTIFSRFNVQADEIGISDLQVNSTLLKDGSLHIEEVIDFKIDDEFNGVFRDIDTKFSGGIENILIKEMTSSGELELKQVEKGKNGQNGVYEISKSGQIYKLKIYAPSKRENKRFKICYDLKNVAKKYSDIGELQYRFWGDGNETTIDRFNINLYLDNKGEGNTVKVFSKGPTEGMQSSIVDSNNFNIKGGVVKRKTPIEGRFLFKKEVIALSSNVINENGLDKILQQEKLYEKDFQEKMKRKESIRHTGNIVGLSALCLNLALGIVIFKVSRRKIEEFDCEFFPEECTPAVASKLYRNTIDEKCVVATILDLVRKKYLHITKLSNDDYAIVNNKREDKELLPHESFIIKWFINYMGDGSTVKLREIENYSKNNKSEFFDKIHNWKILVKKRFDKKGYYDEKSKKLGRIFRAIAIVEMIVMVVFLCSGSMGAIIGIITGISVIIYSLSLLRKKSIYGETQLKKWRRFKEYLEKDRLFKEDLNSIENIDKHLVYAVALGVNNEIFDKININVKSTATSQNNYDYSCLYWYYALQMNQEDGIIQQSINNCCQHHGSSGDGGSSYSGDSGGCAGGGGAGGF